MRPFRVRLAELFLLGLVILSLIGLYGLTGPLDAIRQRDRLRQPDPEGLTPAQFVGYTLTGGLRGLVVDYLWVKSMALIQERRFSELKAVTDLICQLQPYYPSVWVFNAWNLAYNVSVKKADPEEQWYWVKEGINITKEGLKKNPNDIQLTHYLGWLYFHKVAYDDYYRRRLAEEEGLNNWEEAARWFLAARRIDAPHPTLTRSAIEGLIQACYRNRALELFEEKRYQEAIIFVDKALAELDYLQKRFPEQEKKDAVWARIEKETKELRQQIEEFM